MSQIVPLVPEFAARYPEIELQLAFADRRLDLVGRGPRRRDPPRPGPRRDADRPTARRPWPHRLRGPGLSRAPRPPADPADLARHNCILFDQPDYLNQWPFRAADGAIERVRVHGNFRSDNGDALFELLLGGLGIAYAADFLALPHLAAGRLVPLLADHAVDERTAIHAVYPQRRHLPAKVRAFIDFLVERLQPGTAAPAPQGDAAGAG